MDWKHFFNFNLPTDPQVWSLFSWQHYMMLAICLAITFSLYVFAKQYAFLSRSNYFLYSLVGIQILLLVFLKTVQIINIPKYQAHGQDWTGVIPLDFCAITQILSIIAVFWKNDKFFSATILFPIFGSWLTIIEPSSKEALTNDLGMFRFYEFFLAHYLSFFIFFYLYLFGKRKYYAQMWKFSLLGLFIVSTSDYIINTSFGTHFMFMGANVTPGPIDFRQYLPYYLINLGSFLNTFFVIVVMGLGGFWGMFFVLKLIKPLYAEHGKISLHDSWVTIINNKIINFVNTKRNKYSVQSK